MSTRCQIIVKDKYDSIWFYRHSDGYPEGVKDSLAFFLYLAKEGKIRNNAMQASGWLVLIGNKEYEDLYENPGMNWKVGAYEPCTPKIYGNVEYRYTVDLVNMQIIYKDTYENKDELLFDESYLTDDMIKENSLFKKFFEGCEK